MTTSQLSHVLPPFVQNKTFLYALWTNVVFDTEAEARETAQYYAKENNSRTLVQEAETGVWVMYESTPKIDALAYFVVAKKLGTKFYVIGFAFSTKEEAEACQRKNPTLLIEGETCNTFVFQNLTPAQAPPTHYANN